MSINVNVVNQKMHIASHLDEIVAGSQNFVKFRFNLSDDWDGLVVFAQFKQNGVAYNQFLDEENIVCLPPEIQAGTCTMMLYGSYDTIIGTTNYLTLKITDNILVSDASSTDISESLYNQLVTMVDELRGGDISQAIAATPETLVSTIASVRPGTTIQLAPGDYNLLVLKGKGAYPENLTIVGTDGVNMAGVSITSGLNAYSAIQKTTNSDVTMAMMPKNLTFKNITFTDSFCVRNCDIAGLAVHNCVFSEGACFNLVPNRISDQHGNDGSATMGIVLHYATRRAHDAVIKGCHFVNANTTAETTAIYAESIDGITIHNNTVDAAAWNGVQVAGKLQVNRYDAASTGRIAITNNTIRNTGSHSMRLNKFENANIYLVSNKLHSANQTENNIEPIKITGFDSTTKITTTNRTSAVTKESNTYEGAIISADNGITISQDMTAIEKMMQEHLDAENPHEVTAEQIGAVTTARFETAINDLDTADTNLVEMIESHQYDTTNPHQVTAKQIGAAPAGYGLGETSGRYCDDCNTATEIGFYRLSGASCKNVPLVAPYLNYGVMLVERRVEFIQQTVSRSNVVIKRYSGDNGSTWSEWEWVNPPMYPGVEYRTTERFNGEPVYAQLFELGELPVDGDYKVAYFNGFDVGSGIPHLVRMDGEFDGAGVVLPLESVVQGSCIIEIGISREYETPVLEVFYEPGEEGWTLNVTVYYTKTQSEV